MEVKLASLRQKFPGRESQLELLSNFYSDTNLPFPKFLYFWGPQHTCKTQLTKQFFSMLNSQLKLIYLDFNLIFDLDQLISTILISLNLQGVSVKDLGQLLKLIALRFGGVKVLFILDHCKNYKQNYSNQFINLSKEFNFHLILISNLPSSQLIPSIDLQTPIVHHFPNYTKSELSQILAQMNPQRTPELTLRYTQFNNQYLIPIVYQNSKDLKIINELSLRLIMKLNEGTGVINLQKVKLILGKLDLFEMKIEESWIPEQDDDEEEEDNDEDTVNQHNIKVIEQRSENWIDEIIPLSISIDQEYKINNESNQTFNLPTITKLVLMSSYIASYNKSKFDSKLFITQGGGKAKKRGRKPIKDQKVKPISQSLLGPKPFTLIRLNIIFENLKSQIDQNLPHSNILTELNKLREMKLISARGQGQVKWQCEISFGYAEALFSEAGLNINHYLIIED